MSLGLNLVIINRGILLRIKKRRTIDATEMSKPGDDNGGAEPLYRGSCQCGSLRYVCAAPAISLSHCHCVTCRKLHGALYASWLIVPRSAFRWECASSPTSFSLDPEHLQHVRLTGYATRSRCAKCGSWIAMVYDDEADELGVAAGSLDRVADGALGDVSAAHIFVEQKAGWSEIPPDGLARCARFAERSRARR